MLELDSDMTQVDVVSQVADTLVRSLQRGVRIADWYLVKCKCRLRSPLLLCVVVIAHQHWFLRKYRILHIISTAGGRYPCAWCSTRHAAS